MAANKKFQAPWWLGNRHLQSCIGAVMRSRMDFDIRWQEFNLADGDFIDLAWIGEPGRPTVFVLTGFEGSITSHYVQLIAKEILSNNWQLCVIHYRGCSGRMNRLARTYHVGDYIDYKAVIDWFSKKYPQVPLFGVGFSMGSNVLAKYLVNDPVSPLQAVCFVSSPFDVKASVDFCGYFYQWRFVQSMTEKLTEKILAGQKLPISHQEMAQIHHMREIDRRVTAPIFHYDDENDYYQQASIQEDLEHISHPLLLLQSRDDPFVPSDSIPCRDELHANSRLIVSEQGGHIGFMGGGYPWQLDFWIGDKVMKFFRDAFVEK